MKIEQLHRPWAHSVRQGATYTDTSFYRSSAWRSAREAQLRQHPYCSCDDCKGKKVPADMVDHIHPIELGGDPLNPNNLQSMRNHPCHDRKRAREKNAKYKKK